MSAAVGPAAGQEPALTRDAFLGGALQILQPREGYRAASDPVFLAAACPARPGESVLELGCGAGVASLCLGRRVPDLSLLGVERQAFYADLARRNALENDLALRVIEADLTDLPDDLRARRVDHVIANPPYFAAGNGTQSRDAGRAAALREETPLDAWIACARARLAPKGWLTMIQAADRLPDCLRLLADGFGAIAVLPLQPRVGRPARRVLLRARRGSRAPFTLLAPLVLHDGATHGGDGNDYSAAAEAVLRRGAALSF
jgi:tRNA1(Val) A37 N6-methylase TrmN6